MIFTKVSHDTFNNSMRDLSTKDFLKHDIIHFTVDKVLFMFDADNPTSHSLEIERVAGLLHGVYDTSVTNEEILKGAQNLWGAYGEEVPSYFTYEFINRVRQMAHDLLEEYRNLKTGESMELI